MNACSYHAVAISSALPRAHFDPLSPKVRYELVQVMITGIIMVTMGDGRLFTSPGLSALLDCIPTNPTWGADVMVFLDLLGITT